MKSDIPSNSLKRSGKKADCDYVRGCLRNIMWNNVGILRNRKDLLHAKRELEHLKRFLLVPSDKQNFQEYLETLNMLTVALLVTKAALHRKKSLGAHAVG